MASFKVRFLRGSEAANNAYVGPAGEMTIDTVNWRIRLHDGSTQGGRVVPNQADLDDALANFTGGGGTGDVEEAPSTDTTARYVRTGGGVWEALEAADVAADMQPGTVDNRSVVTPVALEAFLTQRLGISYDATLGDWVNDEGHVAV